MAGINTVIEDKNLVSDGAEVTSKTEPELFTRLAQLFLVRGVSLVIEKEPLRNAWQLAVNYENIAAMARVLGDFNDLSGYKTLEKCSWNQAFYFGLFPGDGNTILVVMSLGNIIELSDPKFMFAISELVGFLDAQKN